MISHKLSHLFHSLLLFDRIFYFYFSDDKRQPQSFSNLSKVLQLINGRPGKDSRAVFLKTMSFHYCITLRSMFLRSVVPLDIPPPKRSSLIKDI